MENLFLEAVKLVNPIQLIIIALIVFYFYNRTDNKIEKLEIKIDKVETNLNNKIDKVETSLNDRIDKVETKIVQINMRLDNLYHELFKRKSA